MAKLISLVAVAALLGAGCASASSHWRVGIFVGGPVWQGRAVRRLLPLSLLRLPRLLPVRLLPIRLLPLSPLLSLPRLLSVSGLRRGRLRSTFRSRRGSPRIHHRDGNVLRCRHTSCLPSIATSCVCRRRSSTKLPAR
jgi:hypothetical protein